VMISALYLGCHQLLIHLAPVNSNGILRILFVLAVLIAIIVGPYHFGNLINRVINLLEDSSYVVEVDEQLSRTNDLSEDRFWKPGPNFVRRVVARYYLNNLFVAFIFLFLFDGLGALRLAGLLLGLLLSVGFLLTLAARAFVFVPVLAGYLALMYYASIID
jgi:hypothetical protein